MASCPASWGYLSLILLLGCYITPGQCAVCAGLDYFTANTSSVSFTTPNYPSNYGINVYCTWMIEALDSSHFIRLTVDASSLEDPDGSGSCSYDYARVHDGRDMSATLLGEWCGDTTTTLTSTGTYMFIVFRSDYITVSTGFQASYYAGTFPTVSSSEDYTIIIASCTAGFVVIVGGIIAFCCICNHLKKKKAKQAADKQALPENDSKYQSDGGRSMFTQHIIASREGKRPQPLEPAADDAAEEAQSPEKQKKKEEKAARKKALEERKAKRANKKVGFEESFPEFGTFAMSSALGNQDSDIAATGQGTGAGQNDPHGKTSPGGLDTAPKPGQIVRDGSKMVLLPTVVMVDSADQMKQQKAAGKWENVPSNQAPGTSETTTTMYSATSLEKDEGPLQRESSVVSPSLVTSSFVSHTPLQQPVPIEAPSTAAGTILNASAPKRASTATGKRQGVTTTKPPPVKDAFLKGEDPNAFFHNAAKNQLGKPDKDVNQGRQTFSR